MTEPDIEAFRACTKRVTDWFVSTLEPDGTIRDELPNFTSAHKPVNNSRDCIGNVLRLLRLVINPSSLTIPFQSQKFRFEMFVSRYLKASVIDR